MKNLYMTNGVVNALEERGVGANGIDSMDASNAILWAGAFVKGGFRSRIDYRLLT